MAKLKNPNILLNTNFLKSPIKNMISKQADRWSCNISGRQMGLLINKTTKKQLIQAEGKTSFFETTEYKEL